MATKLITKNGTGAPTTGQVDTGELAVDTTNGRLYTKDTAGTSVIELGLNPNGNVNVTGTVTADGLTVDGASVFNNSNADVDFTVKGDNGTAVFVDGGTNDVSFYEDTGTTAKFFWDASAESLGIGTTSPNQVGFDANGASLTVFGAQRSALTLGSATPLANNLCGAVTFNSATSIKASVRGYLDGSSNGYLTFTTNDDSERMRIDSSGRLLLNSTTNVGSLSFQATAPSGFSVGSGFYSGTTQSTICFKDTGTTADYNVRLGSAADDMVLFAGNAERMRIDSSGNVGIGTSSPSLPLDVHGGTIGVTSATAFAGLQITSANTSFGYINFGDPEDGNIGQIYYGHTDNALSFKTNNSERARIDSSGNVGIGTISPAKPLHISGSGLGTSAPTIRIGNSLNSSDWSTLTSAMGRLEFYSDDTSGNAPYTTGFVEVQNDYISGVPTLPSGALVFGTAAYDAAGGAVERMRIDSSGNVLVGKTTADNTTAGMTFYGSAPGAFSAVRANNLTGIFNRLSSDGDIVEFRKDGATVGSIGSVVGAYLRIGTSDTGIMFQNGTSSIEPRTESANNDAAINLGAPTNRFKDLYLSGNVLVGTTSGTDKLNVYQAAGGTICTLESAGTSGAYALQFKNPNGTVGNVTISGSATSYNTSSDYRLKEDIQDITGATDRLMALKPCNFAWKADGSRVDGFLAHEAQAVVPEAVHGAKDEVDDEGNPVYQGIDQSKLVPLLTKALQEALTRIETLEAEVATLKGN